MARALTLAADPTVPLGPNPRVGCVLLDRRGRPIAEGRHRGAGTPHAEAAALAAAGHRARGATAVVTLEPCNHTGRTPPCAQALVGAGVRRVVYAQSDPNPVAVGGADTMRRAGVDVESGLLAGRARDLNVVWTFAMDHQRPFVTWKFAASLDGRSAAADGSSRWVTGPEARRDVHRLRAEADVVLVGTGTAVADDPRLTARDADDEPVAVQPLRAVMGLRDLPATLRMFDDTAETVALRTRDPGEALTALFNKDRQHVWLEGGPRLAGAFWRSGLVDRVIAYLAPVLLGGGPAALVDAGVDSIDQGIRLEVDDLTRIGPDVRLTARLVSQPSGG